MQSGSFSIQYLTEGKEPFSIACQIFLDFEVLFIASSIGELT